MEFYQKCLEIELKILDENDPSLSITYFNLGQSHENSTNYPEAIACYEKAYTLDNNNVYASHLADCHAKTDNKSKALEFYIQAAEIQKDEIGIGAENDEIKSSIENTIRLAKELNIMEEVPEWIRNINNNQ